MSGSETKPMATMKDSGMATFARKESEDLTCVKSHPLSDNPMLLHCGHRMCASCYRVYIQDKDRARPLNCPSGNPKCDPSNIENVRPDYWAIRRLKEKKPGSKQDTMKVTGQAPTRKEVIGAPKTGSKRQAHKENLDPKRPLLEVSHQELVATDATAAEYKEKLRSLEKELAGLMRQVNIMECERTSMMKRFDGLEEIVQRLQRENDDVAARMNALESSAHKWATQVDMGRLETAMAQLRLRFAGVENSLNTLPSGGVEGSLPLQKPPNDDGMFIWKIQNYHEMKTVRSLTSEPFRTAREGYKLRARLYLNGDGIGAIGKYISLFVVILKGDYDAVLTWPFAQKLTFTVKAQNVNGDKSRDIVKIVEFDQNLPSCERPGADLNPAFGVSKFAKIADIEALPYLVEQTLILKISAL